jgi:hypothetical protein
VTPSISKPGPIAIVAFIRIDHHMAIIKVKIGKNIVEDTLLNGRFGMNIIIKN